MQILQDQNEFNVIFVHSKLDDASLTPYAFRVYCHIARRANRARSAWPGLGSIAKICEISESTARRAIQELEDLDMLIVQRCAGGNYTNLYTLTSADQWKVKKQDTPVSQTPHPCPTETTPLSVGHPKVIQEGNPYIPELKNSGHEPLELFSFPKPVEKVEIQHSAPKKRGRPPKPADPRHQEVKDMWMDLWNERFSTPYSFHVKDAVHLKAFLASNPSLPVSKMREALEGIWSLEVQKGAFASNSIRILNLCDLCLRWNTIIGHLEQ